MVNIVLNIKLKLREYSDKHYKIPKNFHRLNLDGVVLKLPKHDIDIAKLFIDRIRELNNSDPGFCYTCESTDNCIIWYFGYTDIKICDSVYKIGETMFYTDKITGHIVGYGGTPIMCPLLGR